MKKLQNKLRDQSGASILLALLFLLLCAMVGASVLMAAASNAGKTRSNREEQQKYLLLSSALRLVCDELTSAEYYGQYDYQRRTEEQIVVQPDGTEAIEIHIYHEYTQKDGDFQCGGLEDVLPLTEELDLIFASKFDTSYDDTVDGKKIHYVYKPKSGTLVSTDHEMTLSVDGLDGLDGPENNVTVKVRMDQDLRIWLTAALGEEKDGYIYTMEAQLTGQGGELTLAGTDSAIEGENRAGPVTWNLEWIAKKEAGDVT